MKKKKWRITEIDTTAKEYECKAYTRGDVEKAWLLNKVKSLGRRKHIDRMLEIEEIVDE